MLLQGQTAIVTGATRGIGRAIAERFLSAGARVVVAARGDAIAEVARDLQGEALGVACDVSKEGDVARLVQTALSQFGAIDVLVNNAGIARDGMIHRMTLEDFRAVIDVNLQGTWLCSRAVVSHMRDTGGGAIVNISSISGKAGNLGQGNYAASKAGIVALTQTLAREGASKGIRANAIRPGLIRTELTEALTEDAWQRLLRDVPLGRPGEPQEVAEAALFLASSMSSYVTGAVVDVSGGRYM
jgi:3-oxoacyl-[acyl-carrier protein] reductase